MLYKCHLYNIIQNINYVVCQRHPFGELRSSFRHVPEAQQKVARIIFGNNRKYLTFKYRG